MDRAFFFTRLTRMSGHQSLQIATRDLLTAVLELATLEQLGFCETAVALLSNGVSCVEMQITYQRSLYPEGEDFNATIIAIGKDGRGCSVKTRWTSPADERWSREDGRISRIPLE